MANLMVSTLMETDILGAYLGSRVAEALKVTELKFWLRCRGATRLSKLRLCLAVSAF